MSNTRVGPESHPAQRQLNKLYQGPGALADALATHPALVSPPKLGKSQACSLGTPTLLPLLAGRTSDDAHTHRLLKTTLEILAEAPDMDITTEDERL